jgi:hypothetical protein
MKYIKYITIVVMVALSGCSSDKSNSNSDVNNDVPAEVIHKFSLFVNGVQSNLDGTRFSTAYRKEHTIHIGGEYPEDVIFRLQISFDENGHFGKMIYKVQDNSSLPAKYFYTNRNYSSQHFNFIIQQYDQVNRRIKGSFSGYLFIDPENLSSESKFVSGDFDLPIVDMVPPVSGLINEATINSQYWRSTNQFQTQGDNTGQYEELNLHCLRDDEYKMTFTFHKTNSVLGTYSFTPATLINKIKLSKYDLTTSTYINYECTGTVQVLLRPPLCFDGIYNFTAVNPTNPSDVIQVQNGKFRIDYWPY